MGDSSAAAGGLLIARVERSPREPDDGANRGDYPDSPVYGVLRSGDGGTPPAGAAPQLPRGRDDLPGRRSARVHLLCRQRRDQSDPDIRRTAHQRGQVLCRPSAGDPDDLRRRAALSVGYRADADHGAGGSARGSRRGPAAASGCGVEDGGDLRHTDSRSEEHTSELQSRVDIVCRLLLEKNKSIQMGSVSETGRQLSNIHIPSAAPTALSPSSTRRQMTTLVLCPQSATGAQDTPLP